MLAAMRAVAIVEIAGAMMSTLAIVLQLFAGVDWPAIATSSVPWTLLYSSILGIAGIALLRQSRVGYRVSLVMQVAQIPHLVVGGVRLLLVSGVYITLALQDGSPVILFGVFSPVRPSGGPGNSIVGVNIVAALSALTLIVARRQGYFAARTASS